VSVRWNRGGRPRPGRCRKPLPGTWPAYRSVRSARRWQRLRRVPGPAHQAGKADRRIEREAFAG
jgi:hypothetical protein